MAKSAASDQTKVDVEQFCAIMACSEDEVRVASRKGIIPRVVGGKLPLVESIRRMSVHLRDPEMSITEAAEYWGMSQQWLRQLIAQGYVEKLPNGRLRKYVVGQGWIKWLRDDARRSTKGAAENKVKDARAREIELRIAQRERDLIPLEDALAFSADLCGVVRQNMDSIPARVTRDLALRRLIEKEVNEALKRISDRASELGQAIRVGEDAAETGDDDDAGPVGRGE